MENNNNNPLRLVQATEARVNVTFNGEIGDLPDPVPFDATDGDIKQWVTEAVRNGSIGPLGAHARADFTDFVVERFSRNEQRDHNLIMLRPKTPFGA